MVEKGRRDRAVRLAERFAPLVMQTERAEQGREANG